MQGHSGVVGATSEAARSRSRGVRSVRSNTPDRTRAAALADALGGGATTGEWGTAPAGDIVVVALLHDAVVPVATQYGDALAGKVVVDVSNPYNATFDGQAHGAQTSVAQRAAEAAPAGVDVVKAFNTVFRHVLEKGRPDVFVAGDSARAKARVGAFVESLGLRPLDVGGLAMAHWLEGAGLLTVGLANHGVGNPDFALGVTRLPA